MTIASNKGEMVIYTASDGTVQTEVSFEADTLWLSQKMMAELFDKDSDTISLHLKLSIRTSWFQIHAPLIL